MALLYSRQVSSTHIKGPKPSGVPIPIAAWSDRLAGAPAHANSRRLARTGPAARRYLLQALHKGEALRELLHRGEQQVQAATGMRV